MKIMLIWNKQKDKDNIEMANGCVSVQKIEFIELCVLL